MNENESNDSLFGDLDLSLFTDDTPDTEEVNEEVDTEDVETDEGNTNKETPSDESDDNESSSSSSYQVLAKALSEEGVFSLSEDELKNVSDAEKIIELVQREINSRVEEYKITLPKQIKELLDGYDAGADPDELVNVHKTRVQFEKIKEDDLDGNEELMKQVIAKDLELKGYSKEDIEEEIDDIFSLGKEDIKSKKALKNISRHFEAETERIKEEASAREQELIQRRQEQITNIKKALSSTTEIGGAPVSKKIQEDAFKAMTTAVAEVNGSPINAITKSRLENPVEFDKNVAVLWTLTDGFKKWDAFGKAAKKKALNELDKIADSIAKEKALGAQPTQRSRMLGTETVLSDIDLSKL